MATPDDFHKAYEDLSMKLENLFTEDEIIYYILSDNHGRNTENVTLFVFYFTLCNVQNCLLLHALHCL